MSMDIFPFTDGYLGGICNANTTSGCMDVNAVCQNSICQCNVQFTDINGTCKAGKSKVFYLKSLLNAKSCIVFDSC